MSGFETFLWLFVFLAGACWLTRKEESMTWYIIFVTWRVNGVLQFDPIDAVLRESSESAMKYAKKRHNIKRGESLRVEACLTPKHVKQAKALHDQNCPWSQKEFTDWMRQPAYVGDQDKYLRTWTS